MTVRKLINFEKAGYRTTNKLVYVPRDDGLGEHQFTKEYLTLIMAAKGILYEERPMTVRQIYYALFSAEFIHNSKQDYARVVQAMVQGRQTGLIPWDWVEDRLRRPRRVGMWDDLPDFLATVKEAYRRDIWQTQEDYFEFWLEKDALSGIFQQILDEYGITLNVGRGYDGWSSLRNAAERFRPWEEDGKTVRILYFGDFDPSGEDMPRSLGERIGFFGVHPQITKLAITREDIDEFELPQAPGKTTDSRSAGFEREHGELIQVELDALPVAELRRRIREAIEEHLDMTAWRACQKKQEKEDKRLSDLIESLEEEVDDSEE